MQSWINNHRVWCIVHNISLISITPQVLDNFFFESLLPISTYLFNFHWLVTSWITCMDHTSLQEWTNIWYVQTILFFDLQCMNLENLPSRLVLLQYSIWCHLSNKLSFAQHGGSTITRQMKKNRCKDTLEKGRWWWRLAVLQKVEIEEIH